MTGKGNATKDEMIEAAKQKGFNPETDDEADAIAVIIFALNILTSKNKNMPSKSDPGSFRALGERADSSAPITLLASGIFQRMTGTPLTPSF